MIFRPFQLTDVPDIADIYNDYILHSTATFDTELVTPDEMQQRMLSIAGSFPFIVCEWDGKTIAYCYAHPWKEKAAYGQTLETTVYVASAFTGQGIGRQLMTRLIDQCRTQGYHALIACITSGNEDSEKLHQKLGFRKVSQFEQVGRKFDRWLGVTDYELLL